jgi:hypothetical protein
MPKGPNGYDLTVMHPFRGARFNDSVATNGRYWAGPLTNFAINTATYLFTYHFFSNYSAEYPDGYLSEETLKSFEGVTGEKGSFKWSAGRERIPENVSLTCHLFFTLPMFSFSIVSFRFPTVLLLRLAIFALRTFVSFT